MKPQKIYILVEQGRSYSIAVSAFSTEKAAREARRVILETEPIEGPTSTYKKERSSLRIVTVALDESIEEIVKWYP